MNQTLDGESSVADAADTLAASSDTDEMVVREAAEIGFTQYDTYGTWNSDVANIAARRRPIWFTLI